MRTPLARIGAFLVLAVSSCASRPPASPPARAVKPIVAHAPPPAPPPPIEEPCHDEVPSQQASPAPAPEDDTHAPEIAVDDGFEMPALDPSAGAAQAASPLDALSDAELEAKLAQDPSSLGSMSFGRPHSGSLLYPERMPEGPRWELMNPGNVWGTKETVAYLIHSINAVNDKFPNTPKAFMGDISAKGGGHLPPHVSHQAGRDVDISYYLKEGHSWYARATAKNLDFPRTWAFIRTLLTDTDPELIFIDYGLQKIIKAYAEESGEDRAWLDNVFQYGAKSARPIILHASGHATHIHVRFYSPLAQELARRAYKPLLAKRLIRPPTYFIEHKVKPGETIGQLAAKYHTTIEAIRKANQLASNRIMAGRSYRVPRKGGVEALGARLVLPPRRLPPVRVEVAALVPKPESPASDAPCKRARASAPRP